MTKYIYISKLDAAKRQLETAITLFMNDGDAVSIHALTMASYEVLETLGKNKGISSFTAETINNIKPEYQKEIGDKFFEAKNFFKHATRDPEKILEFKPVLNEFFLLFSCDLYRLLTKNVCLLFFLYRVWFFTKRPNLLGNKLLESKIRKIKLNYNDKKSLLGLLPIIASKKMIFNN